MAEGALRKALANWFVAIGPRRQQYAAGLASLAVVLAKRQPEEAARLFREAIDILAEAFGGEEAQGVGAALVVYGSRLARMKRKKEAKELIARGEAILARYRANNGLGNTLDVKSRPVIVHGVR